VTISAHSILDTFEALGLRNTRPRRLIAQRLAELAARGEDFATDELWQELLRVDPQLGRATVFRSVDVLVEQGVLDRVPFADGTHRYRVCGGPHHHHLTCTRCHQIVELALCLPEGELSALASQTGFDIEGHAIEVFGRCPACRTAGAASS
jgi:Fur family transcriptional regulator, ferric uptake regulator